MQNVTQIVIKTTVGTRKSIGTCIFMMKMGYLVVKELHSLEQLHTNSFIQNSDGIKGFAKTVVTRLRLLVKLVSVLIVGKI